MNARDTRSYLFLLLALPVWLLSASASSTAQDLNVLVTARLSSTGQAETSDFFPHAMVAYAIGDEAQGDQLAMEDSTAPGFAGAVGDLTTDGVASDVALDVVGGMMYWIDVGNRLIERATFSGSQRDVVVQGGLVEPQSLALDAAAGKLYWADPGAGTVERVNLDGSGREVLFFNPLERPSGVTLTAFEGNQFVVWIANSIDEPPNTPTEYPKVYHSARDGSNRGVHTDLLGGDVFLRARGTFRSPTDLLIAGSDGGTSRILTCQFDGTNCGPDDAFPAGEHVIDIAWDPSTDVTYTLSNVPTGSQNVFRIRRDGAGGTIGEFSGEAYGLALDRGTPLPVELARFAAQLDGADVVLVWETLSETNNAGFEVQHRRADRDEPYRTTFFVEGAGTTAMPVRYVHRIRDVEPGAHAFRLKQIDYDGTFAFSPEVRLSVAWPQALWLDGNAPNPFRTDTEIHFTVPFRDHAELAVYDLLGRKVATPYEGVAEPGRAYRVRFDGARLSAGVYVYRLVHPGGVRTGRMVLVR